MAKDLGSKEKKRKRTLRAFARECPHQRKLLYTVCVAVTQVDGYFGKCNFLLAFKLSEFRETDTER